MKLDDGRIVEVVAAPEPLAEIRAAEPAALIRIAWHLGNRHLPTELTRRALRIRRDAVIEEMAKGLGAAVLAIDAPFNPEGGAYAGRAGHDHHDHDHDHDQITATTITAMARPRRAACARARLRHDHQNTPRSRHDH